MYKYFQIVASLFILLVSCSKISRSDLLQEALNKSGENRRELEKILFRYQKEDSLKYKAACFLIENMPYYSYYEGNLLDNYLTYFRLLHENKVVGVTPEMLSDSIKHLYGKFSYDSLKCKQDILTLDSAYICNNIDWAFKVWKEQPWGKNVSFDDFCEYILPYRIGDEKPEYWREKLYKEYNALLDPVRYGDIEAAKDPISAVYCLMQQITRREEIRFTSVSPADLPHVGASITQFKSGSCKELTDYAVYVCRALGIPCHIDFIPIRGNDNVGHFWISFKDKNRELYAQDFPESVVPVGTSGFRKDPKVKVYRYTFRYNRVMKNSLTLLDSSFPELFEQPMFIDVTYPYAEHFMQQFTIPFNQLYNSRIKVKIAYLCTARYLEWVPVAWASVKKEGITFTEIQKGDIMRIAVWENNLLIPQSDPFQIDPLTNQITFYSGNDSLQKVTLYSKFTTLGENMFLERLYGGVFEGSDDAGFTHKDTLAVINKVPDRLLISIKSQTKNKYRYVRYYGTEGSHCNVAEVAFYGLEQDTIPLYGEIIGTKGSLDPSDPHEYTNVFDKKTWTSFDYKDPSGGWAGLDFGSSKAISRILFTPRNRDNYIQPGDTYELFYLQKEWKSLGQTTAFSDSIVYENVPQSTLLYLKNHSRGVQERIFTYENEKQIWR